MDRKYEKRFLLKTIPTRQATAMTAGKKQGGGTTGEARGAVAGIAPLDLSPARWIWLPGQYTPPNTVALFRKAITIEKEIAHARGHVSADSRYRLSVGDRPDLKLTVRTPQGPIGFEAYRESESGHAVTLQVPSSMIAELWVPQTAELDLPSLGDDARHHVRRYQLPSGEQSTIFIN